MRIDFFGLPQEVELELAGDIPQCQPAKTDLDFAMIFLTGQAELKKHFSSFARRLQPTGILWVSWPKKSSGVSTDLDENDVRRVGLEAGLVDVKVCAVTKIWSGLKFVIRMKDRAKSPKK